jgi:hypothetical protein
MLYTEEDLAHIKNDSVPPFFGNKSSCIKILVNKNLELKSRMSALTKLNKDDRIDGDVLSVLLNIVRDQSEPNDLRVYAIASMDGVDNSLVPYTQQLFEKMAFEKQDEFGQILKLLAKGFAEHFFLKALQT